jgi:hypothetical protein
MIKTIKIFGDQYILRKTYDIIDNRDGVYGFDILGDNAKFLFHIDGGDRNLIESEIRWQIYRNL